MPPAVLGVTSLNDTKERRVSVEVRMVRAVGLAMVLLCAGGASSASAWTASLTGGTLTVQAAPGERNSFDVAQSGSDALVVSDLANALTGVPAACVTTEDGALSCPVAAVSGVEVLAGDGDDSVTADASSATVSLDGGEGNDQLTGSASPETLLGGPGVDTIDSGPGDDFLSGGDGDDLLNGADGADRVDAGTGNDTVDGGTGPDVLLGGSGTDQLNGGLGDDTLDGGADADQLSGGDGNDIVQGGAAADAVSGEEGDDLLLGGEGPDTLDGGAGRNRLFGEQGADTLTAGPSGDALDGGPDDDVLQGADGPDQLVGGDGNDRLDGANGNDAYNGGAGDDLLQADDGADDFTGGTGADTLDFSQGAIGVAVSLNDRADDGSRGEGDNAHNDLETIVGSPGDDQLTAGPGPVTLRGADGNDTLIGGPAGDALQGGSGDDRLDGGLGSDIVSGEAGIDTIDYGARTASVSVTPQNGRADDGQRGEGDLVDATVESQIGGAGNDRLVAVRGAASTLVGGAGNDRLLARDQDGSIDVLQCGAGRDEAETDAPDRAAKDCELLKRDGLLVPLVTVSVKRLTLDARNVTRVPVTCGTRTTGPCTGQVVLTLTGSSRPLARRAFKLLPGTQVPLRLTISGGRARALRRAHRTSAAVTVTVKANDALGRITSRSTRVRIRLGR